MFQPSLEGIRVLGHIASRLILRPVGMQVLRPPKKYVGSLDVRYIPTTLNILQSDLVRGSNPCAPPTEDLKPPTHDRTPSTRKRKREKRKQ